MSGLDLSDFQRLVVKVGSSLLVDEHGQLNRSWLGTLADDLSDLAGKGHDVLVVSSGAIAIGSSVSLDMSIRLEPAAGDGTRVAYEMEATITGKLALVGNFVLKIKTRELERQMAAQVKARLE